MLDRIISATTTFVSRNSTVILTTVAVVGVVSTSVLAVRGTPGAMRSMEKLEADKPEHTPLDIVRAVAPHYVPALVTGSVTIASIIGAHSVGTRKNAALASAYSLVDRSFSDYRNKIVETFGEAGADKVQTAVIEDQLAKNPQDRMFVLGDGEVTCYEAYSGRYFKSTPETIRQAQNEINGRMIDGVEYSVPLNDLYYALGIEPTNVGDEVGWNTSARLDIAFTSHLTPKQLPCLAITYNVPPYPDYWKS